MFYCSRLTNQAARRSTEYVVGASSGKSMFIHYKKALQDPNSVEMENFRLSIPAKSAPPSGFSSPALSPRRMSNVDYVPSNNFPQGGQVWSAFDSASTAGLSSQTSPEKFSPDCSSLYSPSSKSPGVRSRNPSGPPSPLHHKMYTENSTSWHDNNGNANVHPLPLPPGPAVQSPSGFAHPNTEKPEPSSWQKQKLIGSGTFGNVYEARNR